MTNKNNQIKFFLYENWARTKTGQHTVKSYRYVENHVTNCFIMQIVAVKHWKLFIQQMYIYNLPYDIWQHLNNF